MNLKQLFPTILLSFSLSASASINTLGEKSLDSYVEFFEEQNIFVTNPDTRTKDIDIFLEEFKKFPQGLQQELVKVGGKIHLFQGEGVVDDPSWLQENKDTFDGRAWSKVPGSGGSPSYNVPTRIVVNHLHNGTRHGALNLFLHEHAHTLDSIYYNRGISGSAAWLDLIKENPSILTYSDKVCGSYCRNNEQERFAELFSVYHHNDKRRQEMEREVPQLAKFFEELNSAEDLKRIHKMISEPAPQIEPEEESAPQVEPRENRLNTLLQNLCKKNPRLVICRK